KIPGKLALSLAAGCLILAAFGFGERFISSPSTYVSPIATEESIVKKIQPDIVKRTTDQYPPSVYFPTLLTPKFDEQLEDVSSLAYAAMDRDSRELLLAKNLTLRRPIASIVKVMTALVAIDNIDLSSEYMVTEEATKAGEAVMGLTAGERLTLQELLYGILLPSGNDAAETIAQGPLAGGAAARTTFISRMNEKARNLGMLDSHFVNPTGLDEDKVANSTFSTALDLLALGNYSLNNDMVAKIVGTRTMVPLIAAAAPQSPPDFHGPRVLRLCGKSSRPPPHSPECVSRLP
ncbi:D-alanyl-D-alanine carboxypeptidase, partial [Candidatus Gottesmanbacteria bacterium]|nr:D-alanyl-D-alanine carboxypeptidase [Candidatus Gottesmanbacteria bacterium]